MQYNETWAAGSPWNWNFLQKLKQSSTFSTMILFPNWRNWDNQIRKHNVYLGSEADFYVVLLDFTSWARNTQFQKPDAVIGK